MIRRILFCISAVLLGLVLLAAGAARAEVGLTVEVLRSVLQLYNPASEVCGSAVLLDDGRILTTAHIAAAVCPYADCGKLKIRSAKGLDLSATEELAPDRGVQIEAIFPAADLAVLKIDSPEQSYPGVFRLSPGEWQPASVYTLGFGGCTKLQYSEGQIQSRSALSLETTNMIVHGSSGSPIFDEGYNLVGLVNEAASALDAVKSFLFRSQFKPRALRGDVISKLLTLDPPAALAYQVKLLNADYAEQILPQRGFARALAGMRLVSTAAGIRSDTLKYTPQYYSALAPSSDYISLLPQLPAPSDAAASDLETLAAAYSLEQSGPCKSVLRRVDLESWRAALSKSGRTPEHITRLADLVEANLNSNQLGFEGYFLINGLGLGSFIVVILVLWGASLGYVLSSYNGSIFGKLCMTLVVGIFLWPISFLIYLLVKAIWGSERR